MPEIITSHLTHIVWGLVCMMVAFLVHFWPSIKAWWAQIKADLGTDERRVKAILELLRDQVEVSVQKEMAKVADDVQSVKTRIETAEKNFTAEMANFEERACASFVALQERIHAQMEADVARSAAVVKAGQAVAEAAAPTPVPPTEPAPAALQPEAPEVHGWVPPAVQA